MQRRQRSQGRSLLRECEEPLTSSIELRDGCLGRREMRGFDGPSALVRLGFADTAQSAVECDQMLPCRRPPLPRGIITGFALQYMQQARLGVERIAAFVQQDAV
jgi:hypothetical protein